MNTLSKIIQNRGTPGILIFNLSGQLIFSNQTAIEMQIVLPAEGPGKLTVCDQIQCFCYSLVGDFEVQRVLNDRGSDDYFLINNIKITYSVRPFLIGDEDQGKLETLIMFLVEKVIKRHEVDLDKSRNEFLLTKREAEIAGLICSGFSNREISETLFISVFTVKNHIKNIMKKMGVISRNQIFTRLQ